jgi:hypothetical protein
MSTDVREDVRFDFSRAVAVSIKSQKLTKILPGRNVRIIATPQKPYPSSRFRYYLDPFNKGKWYQASQEKTRNFVC